MKTFSKSKIAAISLVLLAFNANVQADTMISVFTGSNFDIFSGSTFQPGDHISGKVTFDSSLLDASGNGVVQSSLYSINQLVSWQFQDGHNFFTNANDTYDWNMVLDYSNFEVVGWEIDPTANVTTEADIWTNSSQNTNISYYNGDAALASNGVSVANWTTVQADTMISVFTGSNFDIFSGSTFQPGDHISGKVTFDSSLLDASGNGVVQSSLYSINQLVSWQFQDGHNFFTNANDTYDWNMVLDYSNFEVVGWNIDPTANVTTEADIWTNSSQNTNISYYNGDSALASNGVSVANWTTISTVPVPAAVWLFGSALAGFVGFNRRKQQTA